MMFSANVHCCVLLQWLDAYQLGQCAAILVLRCPDSLCLQTFRHFCHNFAEWTPKCNCNPPKVESALSLLISFASIGLCVVTVSWQACTLRVVRREGNNLGRYFYM